MKNITFFKKYPLDWPKIGTSVQLFSQSYVVDSDYIESLVLEHFVMWSESITSQVKVMWAESTEYDWFWLDRFDQICLLIRPRGCENQVYAPALQLSYVIQPYLLFSILLNMWKQICSVKITKKNDWSILTLKRMGEGGGGKIAPPNVFCLYKPNFCIRILPVNISKFKYVHYGHFGTV